MKTLDSIVLVLATIAGCFFTAYVFWRSVPILAAVSLFAAGIHAAVSIQDGIKSHAEGRRDA